MAGRQRSSSPHARGQDPVDQHIALRLRQFRKLAGMSQRQLGTALGLTYQQIVEYEYGRDRISSATLYRAAAALGVPFATFFEGFDEDATLSPPVDRHGEKLAVAVNRIPNSDVRVALISLIATLSGQDEGNS